MTPSSGEFPANQKEATLPRTFWILLPALSLLTMFFLAAFTEAAARWIFPSTTTTGEDCMVLNDPSTGARAIPNSVCHEKIPEGEPTEYRFNRCGHRAGMECGPKAPGTYRIVMVGTSVAIGMRVPREKTFAALLPVELSKLTGRKVELYNEAMPYRFTDVLARHFDEILAAEPDMILLALTAKDLEKIPMKTIPAAGGIGEENEHFGLPAETWHFVKAVFHARALLTSMAELFSRSRTYTLLLHVLYDSQSQYVKSSLTAGDNDMGYLNVQESALWQKRIKEFDGDIAEIEDEARDVHVPIVTVLLPNHAQAAMIAMGEWPTGYDPYKLDEELKSIIASHGGTFIDMMPDIRNVPDPQQGFFPVEGHPNARGHAMMSLLLARELTSGVVPALRMDSQAQAASK